MSWLFNCRPELEAVPRDVAWLLVDSLFRQPGSLLVAAAVLVIFGSIAFLGTGSHWYLAGVGYSALVGIWRFQQTRNFARSPERRSAIAWARRNAASGWATAAGWAGWSSVVLFEPDSRLVAVVLGILAALISGGATRNAAVRAVAAGQIFIASIPLFGFCVLSGNPYLQMYAAFVAMHLGAALELVQFHHNRTVQLLLKEKEASDLVERLAAANRQLEVMNRQLEVVAVTDALTGVANRRAFDVTVVREWMRAARDRTPLSMLLLDVDQFKSYNDAYGHLAGDECLSRVAGIMAAEVRRPGDFLARYGGEEFAVVLPGTDLAGATKIANGIVRAFANTAIAHRDSPTGHVTASIGVACLEPNHKMPSGELVALADAALYRAKRRGRNRVCATSALGEAEVDQEA